MKSTNPVLVRFAEAGQRPRYWVPSQGGSTADGGYTQATGGYAGTAAAPAETGYATPAGHPETVQTKAADVMTVDDVAVKTVGLLAATILSAAVAWAVVPLEYTRPLWIGAAVLGLVIGLVISFKQVTNPAVLFTYAVVEGVFLGMVSRTYEHFYDGIVVNAMIATLGTFLLMAALYRTRVIRATPKFMKVVAGAAGGLVVMMVFNLVFALVTGGASPLRDGGPLAIGFSLVCIVVASLMLVVSFQQIEDGVRAGLPRRYGWIGAFGILVEVIWLYLEFLRLLSYVMSED